MTGETIIQSIRRQRAALYQRLQYATHVRLTNEDAAELRLGGFAWMHDGPDSVMGCEVVIDDEVSGPIVEARVQSNGYLTTWTAEGDPVSVVTDPGPNYGKQIEWHPWP